MPPENTTPPEIETPESGDSSDTSDADAEAFADEWISYKQKIDFIHGILTSEPEKPHWFYRPLFSKKKK
jgi:hypothetical protein